VFQAFEQMVYEPFLTLSYCLVLAAGVFSVIFFDLGFLWLNAAMALANLAQLVPASYILSRKFVRPVFGIDKLVFRRFLQDAVVIGIGVFFYQNLFKINVLMLRWLGTVADVSYFNAPHNLIMQLQVIPMSLVMAVFPLFSRMIYTDREKMIVVYEQIFRSLFIFSSFAAVLLSLYSREIIGIVFGSRYIQSGTALMIISWAMIPLTMDMLLNGVLVAMNKQRYSVIYAGAALVLDSVCCLFFVPKFGFIAAAVIAVISYTFSFLCSLYFIEKNGLSIRFDRTMGKTAAAVCICGTAAYLLKPVSLPLAVVSTVLFFFGTIFMTRAFPIKELAAVRGMIFQGRRQQS
jgi:O-antigen/teichoic acid export membrane protein